ncbi:hypothetical protein [Paraburkholderia piptadeniae]|uniref:hypothetical protein n=1 Tax=Paraburkholderia piptadeniae TaxID=1701573 RepID=UPI00117C8D09|nr:hypothetical protein [Paraburkholderia piptadeniae]
MSSGIAGPHVEQIHNTLADEAEAQHGQGNQGTRENREPPSHFEITLSIVEHIAPGEMSAESVSIRKTFGEDSSMVGSGPSQRHADAVEIHHSHGGIRTMCSG